METASLLHTQAINAAKKRTWIASPYFVPDDAMVQALQLAGLRGVDASGFWECLLTSELQW